MKNILVIGATGQIGSELTMKLRGIYGNDHVVAGYIHGAEPKGELLESGPAEVCDVTDRAAIDAVKALKVDTTEFVKKYNLYKSIADNATAGEGVGYVDGQDAIDTYVAAVAAAFVTTK